MARAPRLRTRAGWPAHRRMARARGAAHRAHQGPSPAPRLAQEELEAIDWYQQRVDATEDPELKHILAHNRDEEKEHASMILEWIRRRDVAFARMLKKHTGHGSDRDRGGRRRPRAKPTSSGAARRGSDDPWLDRERPFAQEIWDRIDATARGAADEVRAGRRLLEVVGPIGFGARAGVAEDLPLGEEPGRPRARPDGSAASRDPPHVRARCARGRGGGRVRRAAQLSEAAESGRRDARGGPDLVRGAPARGRARAPRPRRGGGSPRGDWSDPSRTADDLLGALARLDAAGRHGPYAVALSLDASTSSSARTPGRRSRPTSSSSRRSPAAS